MGFNPYSRLRRARMTKTGDAVFIAVFLLIIVGLVVWAMR